MTLNELFKEASHFINKGLGDCEVFLQEDGIITSSILTIGNTSDDFDEDIIFIERDHP